MSLSWLCLRLLTIFFFSHFIEVLTHGFAASIDKFGLTAKDLPKDYRMAIKQERTHTISIIKSGLGNMRFQRGGLSWKAVKAL